MEEFKHFATAAPYEDYIHEEGKNRLNPGNA
jgi:hypothetical protein